MRALLKVDPIKAAAQGQTPVFMQTALVRETSQSGYHHLVFFVSTSSLVDTMLVNDRLRMLALLKKVGPMTPIELATMLDKDVQTTFTDLDVLRRLSLVFQKDQHRVYTPFTHFTVEF